MNLLYLRYKMCIFRLIFQLLLLQGKGLSWFSPHFLVAGEFLMKEIDQGSTAITYFWRQAALTDAWDKLISQDDGFRSLQFKALCGAGTAMALRVAHT